MIKKIKLTMLASLALTLSVFPSVLASAATTAATASDISVAVTQDNGTTAVAGLSAELYDQNGAKVNITADTATSGTYAFKSIDKKGTFTVVLSKGGAKEYINVAASKFSAYALKTVWVDKDKATVKSGVIGGLAVDKDGKALSDVTVKAYTSKGIWETASDTNGAYKLYVPAGKYSLVVVGKEADGTSNAYANVKTDITVVGNQMNGPKDDQNANTAWATGEDKLGYSITKLASDSKVITGKAKPESTVEAYVYDTTGKTYTLLASAKTSKAVSPATTGTFSITLPDYQIDKTIAVRVTDTALNQYEETTTLAKRDMTLTAATTATIVTPFAVTFADKTNDKEMNKYLVANITEVSAVGADNSTVTLVKTTDTKSPKDYTIAGGKITFNTTKFTKAQDYTITVKATGYNDVTVVQKVSASATKPGALTGTFTAAKGSAVGSTKFTAIGTAGTGNKLVYLVAKAADAAQFKGNVLTGDSKDLVKDTDITGVDATTNKYIDIYEVNSTTSVIVNYKRITLSATVIAPAATADVAVALTTPAADTNNTITGGGATKAVAVSVANATDSVLITGTKTAAQTVAVGGTDAAKVTAAGTGTAPTYTIDTTGISAAGGSATFTLTVSETGKSNIVYTVTVTVAAP